MQRIHKEDRDYILLQFPMKDSISASIEQSSVCSEVLADFEKRFTSSDSAAQLPEVQRPGLNWWFICRLSFPDDRLPVKIEISSAMLDISSGANNKDTKGEGKWTKLL